MRPQTTGASLPSTSACVRTLRAYPVTRLRCRTNHAVAAGRDKDARLESLRDWLLSNGSPTSSFDDCGLVLCLGDDDDGYGVRALATKHIAADDVIVSIPRLFFLSGLEANNCDVCGRFKHDLSSFQLLLLKLLYENHIGEASFWSPYLCTLPSIEMFTESHPLFWKADYLPANMSNAGGKLHERIKSCENDVETFRNLGIGQAVVDDKYWPSLQQIKWATAVLTSRAFHVGQASDYSDSDYDRDEQILSTLSDIDDDVWEVGSFVDDNLECAGHDIALVPWADGLNHSSSATQRSILTYDGDTESAVLRAHIDYEAGDQVFDSYGLNLTCTDMLINYGFVEVAQRSTTLFFEFRGDAFLNIAIKVVEELNSSFSIVQLPGINAAETILRVDQSVGLGEQALCFCESFFEDVPENEDGTQAALLALEVILRMCDDELLSIDENVVLSSERVIKDVKDGTVLMNERAAAYVIVNEYKALRAAKRAVMKQIADIKST